MKEASSSPGDPLTGVSIEQDPRPVVELAGSGVPGAAIATVAAASALALFLALRPDGSGRLLSPADLRASQNAFAPPPELIVPPEPAPAPPPRTVTVITTPAPQVQPTRPPTQTFFPPAPPQPSPAPPPVILMQAPERSSVRSDAPALVIDNGVGEGTATQPATTPNQGQRGGAGATGGDDTPARATVLGNRSTLIPTGTIIPAVLETPIDTARPGLLRAVVSQDTRGFDGRRVLVTRGSRLVGEYQSEVRSGQNRVLVTWTRLIRPDGVSIRLGSPAADPLGGAGIPGRVNTFFLQRFASAVLQSALTVGVNLASRPASGSVIVGLPNAANTVGQSLLPANDLRPKITVKQGAAINVFVARDLDFSGVPSTR